MRGRLPGAERRRYDAGTGAGRAAAQTLARPTSRAWCGPARRLPAARTARRTSPPSPTPAATARLAEAAAIGARSRPPATCRCWSCPAAAPPTRRRCRPRPRSTRRPSCSPTRPPDDGRLPRAGGSGRSDPWSATPPAASAAGPGRTPQHPVHIQQRLLADTWIAATAAPAGSPAGRVRLISDPNQTARRGQRGAAPWLAAATLTQLLTATPAAWSGEFRYTATARGNELTGTQLAAARLLSEQFTHLRRPAGRAEDAPGPRRRSPWPAQRASSWRGRRRRIAALHVHCRRPPRRHPVRPDPDQQHAASVSTTAQLGVASPITIRNDLPPPGRIPTRTPSGSSSSSARRPASG